MTFKDRQLNSMTFQAWKLKFLNSMTMQVVFHDLCEPCICKQLDFRVSSDEDENLFEKSTPLPPPLVWLTFSGLGGLSGRRDLNIAGSARRGSGIPVYPKKIRQNTPKYPKFIQIYPKLYPGILYTWNSKKVIYRIPVFKLQYTVYAI